MITCSRCDFVGHLTALLEHHDAVHGGWRSRRVLRPTRDESNVVTTWRVA